MFKKIKEFFKKNWKNIIEFIFFRKTSFAAMIVVLLGFVYVFFQISTVKESISESDKSKIETIRDLIKKDKESINKLDSILNDLNNKVIEVNSKLDELDSQKTIVKEIYYEKINNVSKYDDDELMRFFSDRYGIDIN
jgi:uncharacterized protein YlxW (UPF0749 family)